MLCYSLGTNFKGEGVPGPGPHKDCSNTPLKEVPCLHEFLLGAGSAAAVKHTCCYYPLRGWTMFTCVALTRYLAETGHDGNCNRFFYLHPLLGGHSRCCISGHPKSKLAFRASAHFKSLNSYLQSAQGESARP